MSTTTTPFASVDEAIEEVRAGRMVVVCDSEDRENEGDLVMAAQFATPEAVNFMATHARGWICLALTEERCEQLGLQLMVRRNESSHSTAFTDSIEARTGVTTGISAADRSRTIMVAIDPNSGSSGVSTISTRRFTSVRMERASPVPTSADTTTSAVAEATKASTTSST